MTNDEILKAFRESGEADFRKWWDENIEFEEVFEFPELDYDKEAKKMAEITNYTIINHDKEDENE